MNKNKIRNSVQAFFIFEKGMKKAKENNNKESFNKMKLRRDKLKELIDEDKHYSEYYKNCIKLADLSRCL